MASIFALLALCGVFLLALFTRLAEDAYLPEKVTLVFLVIAFAIALLPKFQKKLLENRDAATFALMAVFFVLFHLADRSGPKEGFSLHLAILPDDQFPVSYALRLVMVGALASIPAWWKGGGPQRYVFAGLITVGVLGLGSFWFLGQFYKIGATETIDPTPLPTLFLQILGYGAVAALARAVTASTAATKTLLSAMPVLLLALCAKYQFLPLHPVEDAE